MNDGHPIFTQLDPLLADIGDDLEETLTPEVKPREVPDVIGNRLKFSNSWKPEPQFEMQAKIYPDSVRVISEAPQMFDVSSPQDMQRYSDILLSHRQYGRFIITSDESQEWHESKGTWMIMMRVQERVFKTISTSDLNPLEP